MHVLQPKITVLKSDEKEKVLRKFHAGITQLPKISVKDPGLPLGCKKGDVVKIERQGEFSEVYYRVVI